MVGLPTRRFGRTELQIPLLSLGGMRFQQSWSDLPSADITSESQLNLEETLQQAVEPLEAQLQLSLESIGIFTGRNLALQDSTGILTAR